MRGNRYLHIVKVSINVKPNVKTVDTYMGCRSKESE